MKKEPSERKGGSVARKGRAFPYLSSASFFYLTHVLPFLSLEKATLLHTLLCSLKSLFPAESQMTSNLAVEGTYLTAINFKYLPVNVIIQGETEEEMQSWIQAIAGVSPRGRSSSEPVCLHTYCYWLYSSYCNNNNIIVLYYYQTPCTTIARKAFTFTLPKLLSVVLQHTPHFMTAPPPPPPATTLDLFLYVLYVTSVILPITCCQ